MHERWSEGEGQVDHDIDEQQRLGARQSVLYTVSRGERVPRTSLNVGTWPSVVPDMMENGL